MADSPFHVGLMCRAGVTAGLPGSAERTLKQSLVCGCPVRVMPCANAAPIDLANLRKTRRRLQETARKPEVFANPFLPEHHPKTLLAARIVLDLRQKSHNETATRRTDFAPQ